MPKPGIFDQFKNLEEIPVQDLGIDENYFANRLLYPRVLPTTQKELEWDLAILREALKRNPVYFKMQQKKIYIPQSFVEFIPDLKKLVLCFMDAFEPKGIITFVQVTPNKDISIGTMVTVNCKGQKEPLHFEVEGQNFRVKPGTLTVLSCPKEHCHVNFKATQAKLLGKQELLFEVPGGPVGLIVDGRWQ